MASPLFSVIIWTVCCPPSSFISAMTSFAPSRANVRAVARPIPEAPPVTNATLPSTRPAMVSSPVNYLLRQIRGMVIVAEGALGELPSVLRLVPVVVIDAGKHGARGRIMDPLMGGEHHRAGLGMLLGEDIKERPGLIVAVTDLLDHLLVALDHPGMNGSTGFQPEFGLTSSGGKDLKNPAFREELGKPVRIPPVIGIRIPCNHFKNVHLVCEAHRRCPSLQAVGEGCGTIRCFYAL